MFKKFVAILTTPIVIKGIQEILFSKKEPLPIIKILENISTDIDNEILKIADKKQAKPIGGEVFFILMIAQKMLSLNGIFILKIKKKLRKI